MLRWALCFTLIAASFAPLTASAEQYAVRAAEGDKVVHTRVAPVVMHRVLPPFGGRHVYQGRGR